MKKLIIAVLLALITGISFSFFVFSKYEERESLKEKNLIYFIQQGVYSNYSNMVKNTEKLKNYTYEKKDNKYYVYVCFTAKKENIEMIEKYFKSLNYSIYVQEKEINNINFINAIYNYDYLLSMITKEESVRNICEHLVKKYEEYK